MHHGSAPSTLLFSSLLAANLVFFYASAWKYIYTTNIVQGPCVYADFDDPNLLTMSIHFRRGNGHNHDHRPNFIDKDSGPIETKRVVNGQAADITHWPWLVAILTPDGPIQSQGRTWDINCGGTLIHPEFVLTAAHCVIETQNDTSFYRRNPQDLLARIGANNLYTGDARFVDILIDQTFTHPNYNPLVVDVGSDIALLHLSQRYQRGPNDPVREACLPQNDMNIPTGSQCYVAGWGAVSTDGDTSPIPLYTVMEVASLASCNQIYAFSSSSSGDGRLFCVGPHRGSSPTDTCTGDSGGAIFCKNPNGSGFNSLWQLAGLVSFGGEKCAPKDLTPGVYTNISYYRQWVLDTMAAYLLQRPSNIDANDPYKTFLASYYAKYQNSWKR